MCGILGIVSFSTAPLDVTDDVVLRMRDSMRNRGPDDAGLVRPTDRAVFAHRRLSIRDPEYGQQPWTDTTGRYVLVYNGELYNTAELLALTAERFPEPPATHCDTEVLCRMLICFGKAALPHLRGMFAFGFYDCQEHELLLARDRFGIKPLYTLFRDNILLFASSLKALRQHPAGKTAPSREAIAHYLMTLRTNLGSATLYQQIESLEPGHLLTASRNGLEIEAYWSYPEQNESFTEAMPLQKHEELLADAVRSRIVSDVPVGMMLSGGVDSSLLGTFVASELGENFVAECGIGQSSDSRLEAESAQLAAEFLKCHFQTVEVTADSFWKGWQELIAETGQPLVTPSDVIIYRLAQSLAQQVGVVLGGEGADELYCGYAPIHAIGYDFDHYRALLQESGPEAAEQFAQKIRLAYGVSEINLTEMYLSLATLMPAEAIGLLMKDGEQHCQAIWKYYDQCLSRHDASPQSGLQNISELLHRVNLSALLLRLDQATMAASLEARVPYTDHRLVEAIWPTPFSERFAVSESQPTWGELAMELEQTGLLESKSLLRKVARQRLPDQLANRKKASFPTPVLEWMQNEWQQKIQQKLRQSAFLKSIFHRATLAEIVDHPEEAGMWLWPLMNLAIWGEHQ